MLCFPVCKFNHSHGQQCCPSELNYPNRRDGQKSAGYGKQTRTKIQTRARCWFPRLFIAIFNPRALFYADIFCLSEII